MRRRTFGYLLSANWGSGEAGANLAALACMHNAHLDQFIHALTWKAVPVIILCGGGAILLRELLQWLERAADQAGRSRRKSHKSSVSPVYRRPTELEDAPHCPSCNRSMVKRKARRGAHAGSEFWGCPNFPECRGTRTL